MINSFKVEGCYACGVRVHAGRLRIKAATRGVLSVCVADMKANLMAQGQKEKDFVGGWPCFRSML
jgi:hypothetical protein